MPDYVSFCIIGSYIVLLNILFVKFNLIKDKKNTSFHKKFIENKTEPPFSGGIFLFITIFLFLDLDWFFKILLLPIFLIGFFSDLNFFKSVNLRFYLQLISVLIIFYYLNLYVQAIRIDFIDNFLNNFVFKIFFTTFCILILINGSNFLDGVNTLVIGYYLLILIFVSLLGIEFDNFINVKFIYLLIFALSILFILNCFNFLLLGDSGSYLLSVFTGIYLIDLANQNILISPYFIMNLLWYPAYETLFSIIRKIFVKKSPLSPDNMHLHQLIYLFIKNKINNANYANSFSGLFINFYNLLIFYFAFQNYSNTKYQLVLVLLSLIIYNTLYKVLKLNLKR
tara:strand:+ start:44 stop:1060 length:1017 start_codon:yes stop_codon:yes gene_type:complete